MKVYNIQLERNHSFVFYKNLHEELICVNDNEYPALHNNLCWYTEKGFYKDGDIFLNKIAVPTFKIKEEDIFSYLKLEIFELYKRAIEIYNNCNIFICYKDLDNGFLELGLTAYEAKGTLVNETMTDFLQKQIDLQIFA